MLMSCENKTIEWIDVLFGVETIRDPYPINIVLDGVPIPHDKRKEVRCSLCQITLTTCCV